MKAAVLALILAAAAWAALAQAPALRASAGVYSQAQAERGAALYARHCARCHGDALEGTDVAQPLTGQAFLDNWTGQPVAALVERIRASMPLDDPGALDRPASADVAAVVLQANGYKPGPAPLPADLDALQDLFLDGPAAAAK